jgi:hypothetical protein
MLSMNKEFLRQVYLVLKIIIFTILSIGIAYISLETYLKDIGFESYKVALYLFFSLVTVMMTVFLDTIRKHWNAPRTPAAFEAISKRQNTIFVYFLITMMDVMLCLALHLESLLAIVIAVAVFHALLLCAALRHALQESASENDQTPLAGSQ